MAAVAGDAPPLDGGAARRAAAALSTRKAPTELDVVAARREFAAMTGVPISS
jgi:hypothetical protein